MTGLQVAVLRCVDTYGPRGSNVISRGNDRSPPLPEFRMAPQELFATMIGQWKGSCRTWFEPDKLADESEVSGEFASVFDGKFLRHSYEGTIRGRERNGEELLAFNPITKQFQSSWVDDFHMSIRHHVFGGTGFGERLQRTRRVRCRRRSAALGLDD